MSTAPDQYDQQYSLIDNVLNGRISRRAFLTRSVAVGLSASVAGSVLAACTSSSSSGKAKPPAQNAPDPTQFIGKRFPVTVPAAPKKFDPPVEIRTSPPGWVPKFKSGENINDNVLSKLVLDTLGIHYTVAWDPTTADAHLQKWSLALSSGDIPELLAWVPPDIFGRLSKADRLADIRKIWESTASAAVKQKFEYPTNPLWKAVLSNGKLHGLPFFNARGSGDNVLWYRKDLFDQAGASVPDKLEDFIPLNELLVGKKLVKNLLGVANDSQFHTVTYLGSLDPVYGAFGTMPTRWIKGQDGKLSYGSIDPQVKGALEVLRTWYANGVFAKEYFTVMPGGQTGVGHTVISGDAAGYFGPYWVPLANGNQVTQNFPKADLRWAATPPAGPGGKRGRADTSPYLGVTAFGKSIDPVKIEAFIQHLNWVIDCFDKQWNSHYYVSPGSRTLFEGYDYKIEKNALVPGDYLTMGYSLGAEDPQYRYPNALQDYFAKIKDVVLAKPASARNLAEQAMASDPTIVGQVGSFQDVVKTAQYDITTEYTGPSSPTQTTAGGQLAKLEVEAYTNIITGRASVSSFDGFVSQWKAQGGDKITAELNEWYQQG